MTIKAVIFDMYETLITQYRSPVYFTGNIARDAGIEEQLFRSYWTKTEDDRTLGRLSLKEVVGDIMDKEGVYSLEKIETIYNRRKISKANQFLKLHSGIVPMVEELKNMGIKIGLISNCYLEEAEVIMDSSLYKYFDTAILSCKVQMQKPDNEIYQLCLKNLGLRPEECLYVGDGGCGELYGAKTIGMKVLQAMWYLNEWNEDGRQSEFKEAVLPKDVVAEVLNLQ